MQIQLGTTTITLKASYDPDNLHLDLLATGYPVRLTTKELKYIANQVKNWYEYPLETVRVTCYLSEEFIQF